MYERLIGNETWPIRHDAQQALKHWQYQWKWYSGCLIAPSIWSCLTVCNLHVVCMNQMALHVYTMSYRMLGAPQYLQETSAAMGSLRELGQIYMKLWCSTFKSVTHSIYEVVTTVFPLL